MNTSDFYIELGGVQPSNNEFARNKYVKRSEQDKIARYRERLRNTDVYGTVYSYSQSPGEKDINDCLLYGPMYFDFDGEDLEDSANFNKIKLDVLIAIDFIKMRFGVPASSIDLYFSGAKGFHVLIPPEVFGIMPEPYLNIVYKAFAALVNKNTINHSIDTRIYDKKRLFRLENSINSKTGLHKVQITPSLLRQSSYEEIKLYAEKPREITSLNIQNSEQAVRAYIDMICLLYRAQQAKQDKKNKRRVVYDELLPCVEQLLQEGTTQGYRNNSSVALASALLQCGNTEEEAVARLIEWNEKNQPPLPEKEIARTAQSARILFDAGKEYGCAFFKSIGACLHNKDCKLYERGEV